MQTLRMMSGERLKAALVGLGLLGLVIAFSYTYARADGGPTLVASAAVAVPHAQAQITGAGFMAGETVHLTFGATAKDVIADGSGNIASSMEIPAVPSGSYFIGSFGETSGRWALTYLWVSGYAPQLSPSSWYVTPGEAVSLSGSGFAPNESITIKLGSSTIASTTANASGSFSGINVALPVSLSNTTANISAVGAVSNAPTSAGITIGQLYPSVSPSAWWTSPGTIITVAGSGFAPHEGIAVSAGTSHATTNADALGNFTVNNFALPTQGGGVVNLAAAGLSSAASATVGIFITGYSPWFVLSSYWAQSGSALTISGSGFAPNEQVVYSSGGSSIATGTAAIDGTLTLNTRAPWAPAGLATLTLLGSTSNTPASTQMTIAPVYTDLQLGSYAGAPDTAIDFIGHGYAPNEPISLTTSRTGTGVVATWSADATGSFNYAGYSTASSTACGAMNLTVSSAHSFDVKTVGYYVTGC